MDTVLLNTKNFAYFAPYIPQQLIKQLSSPDWMALGAVEDSTAIGVLITHYAMGRLSLEWIYVTPERRGLGIAGDLVDSLLDTVKDGNTRMITACFGAEEFSAPLRALLEDCGCVYPAEEISAAVYELPLTSLTLSGVRASAAHKNSVSLLENVPTYMLNELSSKLVSLPVTPALLPLRKADYLPCSTAFVTSSGIKGVCLLRKSGGFVELSYLYAVQPQALPSMLCASFEQLKRYPEREHTTLRLWAVTDATRRLADKLLPQASIKSITTMAYIF